MSERPERDYSQHFMEFSQASICKMLADGPLRRSDGKRAARIYVDGETVLIRFDPDLLAYAREDADES